MSPHEYGLIGWALFVLGGWCNLRPGPWYLPWYLPVNLFFLSDRLMNVTVVSLIIWVVPTWRAKSPCRWETPSGRIGRDFPGSIAHCVIDVFAMDWSRGKKGGHCRKYIGV